MPRLTILIVSRRRKRYLKNTMSCFLAQNLYIMKKRPGCFRFLLMGAVCAFCIIPSYGQGSLDISAGIGLPELINVALLGQFGQVQLGGGVGTIPAGEDESIWAASADLYYHFAGAAALSDRRPWYGKTGLAYLRDETESVIDKYLYLNARIGRCFNFSEQAGMRIDAGLMFQLSYEEIRKEPPQGFNIDIEAPVLPGLGIGFFYRL